MGDHASLTGAQTFVDEAVTELYFRLPLDVHKGGAVFQFGNVTSLIIETIEISTPFLAETKTPTDNSIAWFTVPAIDANGIRYGAGESITIPDCGKLFIQPPLGSQWVKLTATGSGPVALATLDNMSSQLAAQLKAESSGCNNYFIVCDTTNENLISASARRLLGFDVSSLDATPVYIKFYDKATAPNSSDTPIFAIGLPANSTAANGSVISKTFPNGGIVLTNGLGVRAVTGITNNSNGALTADEVLLNVQWSA